MKAWRHLTAAAALCLVVLVPACTAVTNPATGERQYTSMTPEDEARIGRQENEEVLKQFGGAYQDTKLQAYVDRIGAALVDQSELPDLTFHFTILDDDVVNAFALPGGYVYVTRGLLALANDEAELAGVLGHEIGHVTARHTAQRYDRMQQGQIGAGLVQILGVLVGGALGGETGAQLGGSLLGQAGAYGAAVYVQSYSREQELQADELGVRYMTRAGYDPQAMVTFLSSLEASTALRRQLAGAKSEDQPSLLDSHPRTHDRVQRAIEAAGSSGTGGEHDRDRYLATIDGLLYGPSPDQGFIEGRTFIHPALGFRFTVPEGFRLQNTPSAVLATDGGSRAMMFDMAKASRAGDAAAYLGEWTGGKSLRDVQRIEVAGRQAAVGFTNATLNGRPAEAMLAAVPGDGATMYRFVFLDLQSLSRSDIAAYEGSLRSFRRLSSAEAAKYRPLRIEIVSVRSGDTIDSLAGRMDVDKGKRELFVVLNALEHRSLEVGDQVKLVVRD